MEIIARNTNDLQGMFADKAHRHGVRMESRNGPVLRLPGVTTVTLRHPWERVNFSPARNANPFFHLFEAMAMLAGDIGNDAPVLGHFAKQMMMYSDDGKQYNAFYGSRIRNWFDRGMSTGRDQLSEVIEILRKDPFTRQALVQIWDPELDLGVNTKDKACNLCMIFDAVHEGDGVFTLNMTTFNRSNDGIWGGICGANVVHFSFFHEYVACALGWRMGQWHHSSANLHVYLGEDRVPMWEAIKAEGREMDKMLYPNVQWLFDADKRDIFDHEVTLFVTWMQSAIRAGSVVGAPSDPEIARWEFHNDFLHNVAYPMTAAYLAWKQGNKQIAYDWLKEVAPGDWRLAGLCWFKRREGISFSPHTFVAHDSDFIAAQ